MRVASLPSPGANQLEVVGGVSTGLPEVPLLTELARLAGFPVKATGRSASDRLCRRGGNRFVRSPACSVPVIDMATSDARWSLFVLGVRRGRS